MNVKTKETVERWQFNIACDKKADESTQVIFYSATRRNEREEVFERKWVIMDERASYSIYFGHSILISH